MESALLYGVAFRAAEVRGSEDSVEAGFSGGTGVQLAKLAGQDWYVIYIPGSISAAAEGALPFCSLRVRTTGLSWPCRMRNAWYVFRGVGCAKPSWHSTLLRECERLGILFAYPEWLVVCLEKHIDA